MPTLEMKSAPLQPSIETMIQYVEVWTLNNDKSMLSMTARHVVGTEFCEIDLLDRKQLICGEGFAGSVWHSKSAVLLQEDPNTLLKSISCSTGLHLAALVGLPILQNQSVRGVVVLGFGAGFGAAEVWNRDARDELAVSASHYSGLPAFEFISRYTRFPKGAGVPGSIWKTGCAELHENLGISDSFIRSFGNDPASVSAVVGLPIGQSNGFAESILLLLSSAQNPLAGSIELWNCEVVTTDNASKTPTAKLHHTQIVYTTPNPQNHNVSNSDSAWRQTVLNRVATSGAPLLESAIEINLPQGASACLAIPIYSRSEICNVLSFIF